MSQDPSRGPPKCLRGGNKNPKKKKKKKREINNMVEIHQNILIIINITGHNSLEDKDCNATNKIQLSCLKDTPIT